MLVRRRYDVATQGFDDLIALIGSDPQGTPTRTGVRLPALAGVRYTVLLERVELDVGEEIRGLRQYLEIGAPLIGEGSPPFYPNVRNVTTPMWRFVDGAVLWMVTAEPVPGAKLIPGPNDQESFVFSDSSSPAVLYQTATIPAKSTYLSLTAYTPPGPIGTPIYAFRDIRYPWDQNSHDSWRFQASRPTRLRFYAFIFQTNPSTRMGNGFVSPLNPGNAPEENFIASGIGAQGQTNAIYFAVAGAFIYERRSHEPPHRRRREHGKKKK